jgi:predicted nucleic acid-binding protein
MQYVDASVILRVVLKAPDALREWKTLTDATSSVLLQVECLRTIDRLQLTGEVRGPEVPRTYAALHDVMSTIELLNIGDDVIERAGGPFGVPLKTLDAIHLVTAIAWRERINDDITFVTHDLQLAAAADAYHFSVLGA